MTRPSLLLATALSLASCDSRNAAATGRETAAANPLEAHALAAEERRVVEGTVEEHMQAGHYLYLRIREPSGQRPWLVSLAALAPRQGRVRALVLGRADHFRSRRLAREFHPLLFAAVRAAEP